MKKVTIASFDMLPDAHIAAGRLEAEGIQSWIMDEHLVQTDWLYSIAVGGIKVQVRPDDVSRAQEVLQRDYSHELDLPGPEAGDAT